MNWVKATKLFTGIVFLISVAWDVFVIAKGGTEASISHFVITASYKYPMLPFCVGFTCGHLFWRMKETKGTAEVTKIIKNEEGK